MESISRISSLLETARDLTLEAAQSASAVRGLRAGGSANRRLPIPQLKKLLDSRNERDILDGLRRVISMMYRSEPCLPLFSSVIKNVASPSMEIKKLVYIYLLHYAESEPDLALLSINTIQKSLTDQNPQARAMALKAMSGIRVPVISQIVSLAIKKGSGDMSPVVRRAAALAIPKCYRLEPGTLPQLLDYLSTLLGDKQYYVAGAAVMAFLDVCPERIDLIHKHYRNLVRKLVDMDEWGQLATLRLMTVYARKCFPRRTRKSKADLYDDKGGVTPTSNTLDEDSLILDADLELLLNACRPLLQSRNSAVIVSVVRCFVHLGTPEHVDQVVGPLVSLLRSPLDIQHLALYNIVSVCLVRPRPFVRYATRFLVHSTDSRPIWRLKLEVLTLIFPHCDPHLKGIILNELHHFSQQGSFNKDLVRESVQAVGRCAQTDPNTSGRCLRLLLRQVSSPEGTLVAESLTVIRHLIQHSPNPETHLNTVIHLAKNLDTVVDPHARATIIWLVGEFAGVQHENNIAADVLRILAKNFADESEMAKMQIVVLAAKVYVHHHLNMYTNTSPQNYSEMQTDETQEVERDEEKKMKDQKGIQINLLWNYIFLLSRYDTSYDLRDRARFLKALLSTDNGNAMQLATLLLLAPKPSPYAPSPSESRRGYVLGSMWLVLGGVGPSVAATKYVSGGSSGGGGLGRGVGMDASQAKQGNNGNRWSSDEAFNLPEWVKEGEEPDPRLRDEPIIGSTTTAGGVGVGSGFGKGTVPHSGTTGGNARHISAAERLDGALRASKSEGSGTGNGYAGFHSQSGGNNNNGNSGRKEKTLDDWLAEDDDDNHHSAYRPSSSKKNVEKPGRRREDDEEEEDEDESGSTEEESGSEEDDEDVDEEEEEGEGGEGQKLISK